MRLAARTDENQSFLVSLWRKMGVSVLILSGVGKGCPDLLLGFKNKNGDLVNLLVEVKDGDKPLSKQKLTEHEQFFFETWRGHCCIIRDAKEAMSLIKLHRGH